MDKTDAMLRLDKLRAAWKAANARHAELLASMPSSENMVQYMTQCQQAARSTDYLIALEKEIEELERKVEPS